jgi:hypothetical protein
MEFQLLFLVHLCVFLPITMYTIRFPLHFEEIRLNHVQDGRFKSCNSQSGSAYMGCLGMFPFCFTHISQPLIWINALFKFTPIKLLIVLCLILSFASSFHVDLKFKVAKLRVQTVRWNTRNVC